MVVFRQTDVTSNLYQMTFANETIYNSIIFIRLGFIDIRTKWLYCIKNTLDVTKTELWEIISSNDSLISDYHYANNLNYSELVYKSDSLTVDGFVISPKAKGHYPVIIFNRGGNRDFNKLTLKMLFFSTAVLANEGYIILASNYRIHDEFGGKDLNDVLNLIHVADQLEYADTSRIGMFGWSRGGMMTYLSLKESDRIKTAVIGNGVSDLFLAIEQRPELELNVISECIPNYWVRCFAFLAFLIASPKSSIRNSCSNFSRFLVPCLPMCMSKTSLKLVVCILLFF